MRRFALAALILFNCYNINNAIDSAEFQVNSRNSLLSASVPADVIATATATETETAAAKTQPLSSEAEAEVRVGMGVGIEMRGLDLTREKTLGIGGGVGSEENSAIKFESVSSTSSGVLTLSMIADTKNEYKMIQFDHQDENGIIQKVTGAPIVGCASVVFSVPVKIGSSSSTYNLIVDTGSTSLAVASSLCRGCGVSPLWSPSSSSELEWTNGPVTSIYASNTGWSGSAYRDHISIGSATANLIFATIDSTKGSFFQSAGCDASTARGNTNQGIIGFAYPRLALPPTQSFFQQWQSQTGAPNIFTIQMCQKAGNIWLGGYDDRYKGQFHWTPIVDNIWYSIYLADVQVDGRSLGLSGSQYNPRSSAVDSGTTLTILPSPVYNALVNSLQSNSEFVAAFGSSFFSAGYCSQPRNGKNIAQLNAILPKVSYFIGGSRGEPMMQVTLNPVSSYVYAVITNSNEWLICPGIVNGGSNGAVYGWTWMNQYIIAFDVGMNRLGISPSPNCQGSDSHGNPTGSPPGFVSGGIISNLDSYTAPPPTQPPPPPPPPSPTTTLPTQPVTPTCSIAVWWATTTWSGCTKTCGGGQKTRSVSCLNMASMKADESLCSCSASKPSSIDTCNTQKCAPPSPYVSAVYLNSSASSLTSPIGGNILISFTMGSPDTTQQASSVLMWIQSSAENVNIYISRSIPVSYSEDGQGGIMAGGEFLWQVDASISAGQYQVAVGVSSSSYQVGPFVTLIDPCVGTCDSSDTCENQYGSPVCLPPPTPTPTPTYPQTVQPTTLTPFNDTPSQLLINTQQPANVTNPPSSDSTLTQAPDLTSYATTSTLTSATTTTPPSPFPVSSTSQNVTCVNGASKSESGLCICGKEYSGDSCELVRYAIIIYVKYSYSSLKSQEVRLESLLLTDLSYALNISVTDLLVDNIESAFNNTFTAVTLSLVCDTRVTGCDNKLVLSWIDKLQLLVNNPNSILYQGLAGSRIAKIQIITDTPSTIPTDTQTQGYDKQNLPSWAVGVITSIAASFSILAGLYFYHKYRFRGLSKQSKVIEPYVPKDDANNGQEEFYDDVGELKLKSKSRLRLEASRPKKLEKSNNESSIAMLATGANGIAEATSLEPPSPYTGSINLEPTTPFAPNFDPTLSPTPPSPITPQSQPQLHPQQQIHLHARHPTEHVVHITASPRQ